jgi:hypothetical protein
MSSGLQKLLTKILKLRRLIPLKRHPYHLENTAQEVNSI